MASLPFYQKYDFKNINFVFDFKKDEINLNDLKKETVEGLDKKFKDLNNGNCHLKITIISNNNGKNISLDMISRDKKFKLEDGNAPPQ